MNDVEKLIELLERKQSEIHTDFEDYENIFECTEEYKEGFLKGLENAFNLAISIVKENPELFKRNDK